MTERLTDVHVLRNVVLRALVVAGLLWTFPAAAASAAKAPDCQVKTHSGAVVGRIVGNSCVYKGIPYAAPPIGALRFRPPAEHDRWNGVLDASDWGTICPQLAGTPPAVIGGEDCLNLNVWAPISSEERSERLPVVIYIHGGGNRVNSGRSAGGLLQDGQYIAERGNVVVVTINYRLGALGWLANPALDTENPRSVSGNYGLLDQIAALRWVRRNISRFGGDPDQVLVTGQSAGARNAAVLLVSPLARGLFSSVLVESAGKGPLDEQSLATYEAGPGATIVKQLGCAIDVATCLRSLPAAEIVTKAPGSGGLRGGTYGPVVDGYVLPDRIVDVVRSGNYDHVPFIVGTAAQESSLPLGFVPADAIPDDAAYRAAADALWGPALSTQVRGLYPSSQYSSPREAFVTATTDYRWTCAARQLARAAAAAQDEPVYRYVYTHQLATGPKRRFQAFHTQDLMFLFHSFSSDFTGAYTPTADELALSDEMIGYWARFASGDPNGERAVFWPLYDVETDPYLRLDTPTVASAGFRNNLCDFWDSVTN
jgi:para-nitrobenzyl esterase